MFWRILLALTWELPQTVAGVGALWILGRRRRRKAHPGVPWAFVVEVGGAFGGVSLAPWIFVDRRLDEALTWAHEYGHSRQSRILGPLYLVAVGLPSVVNFLLSARDLSRHERGLSDGSFARNYYRRYPENWADRLGGVGPRS